MQKSKEMAEGKERDFNRDVRAYLDMMASSAAAASQDAEMSAFGRVTREYADVFSRHLKASVLARLTERNERAMVFVDVAADLLKDRSKERLAKSPAYLVDRETFQNRVTGLDEDVREDVLKSLSLYDAKSQVMLLLVCKPESGGALVGCTYV